MILLVSSEISKVVGVLVAFVCPFSFSCDKDNYQKPFDRDFIGLQESTRGRARAFHNLPRLARCATISHADSNDNLQGV